MSLSHAKITVSNLRLRTYIGFNPEEREKQQDVIINIDLCYPAESACRSDQVADALDYKRITKNVIRHVEQGQFLLLERLTADILAICSDDSRVTYAKVSIDKPHALRFADSVSVTLEYQRDPTITLFSNHPQTQG